MPECVGPFDAVLSAAERIKKQFECLSGWGGVIVRHTVLTVNCEFVTSLVPTCKVHGCKVFFDVRSIVGRSQSNSTTH